MSNKTYIYNPGDEGQKAAISYGSPTQESLAQAHLQAVTHPDLVWELVDGDLMLQRRKDRET